LHAHTPDLDMKPPADNPNTNVGRGVVYDEVSLMANMSIDDSVRPRSYKTLKGFSSASPAFAPAGMAIPETATSTSSVLGSAVASAQASSNSSPHKVHIYEPFHTDMKLPTFTTPWTDRNGRKRVTVQMQLLSGSFSEELLQIRVLSDGRYLQTFLEMHDEGLEAENSFIAEILKHTPADQERVTEEILKESSKTINRNKDIKKLKALMNDHPFHTQTICLPVKCEAGIVPESYDSRAYGKKIKTGRDGAKWLYIELAEPMNGAPKPQPLQQPATSFDGRPSVASRFGGTRDCPPIPENLSLDGSTIKTQRSRGYTNKQGYGDGNGGVDDHYSRDSTYYPDQDEAMDCDESSKGTSKSHGSRHQSHHHHGDNASRASRRSYGNNRSQGDNVSHASRRSQGENASRVSRRSEGDNASRASSRSQHTTKSSRSQHTTKSSRSHESSQSKQTASRHKSYDDDRSRRSSVSERKPATKRPGVIQIRTDSPPKKVRGDHPEQPSPLPSPEKGGATVGEQMMMGLHPNLDENLPHFNQNLPRVSPILTRTEQHPLQQSPRRVSPRRKTSRQSKKNMKSPPPGSQANPIPAEAKFNSPQGTKGNKED